MENNKAEALLQAAIKCDLATGQKDTVTSLAKQVIDGSSTTAKMSLLWKISDASNSKDPHIRAAFQELQNFLMSYK